MKLVVMARVGLVVEPAFIGRVKVNNKWIEVGALFLEHNNKNGLPFKINKNIKIDLNKIQTIYLKINKQKK